ncbi:hypothetical protein H0H93_007463 [Arthromyces matolae]|nr:hypothetical protein H0H93_007463 [Arthromyces matolae]
MSLLNRSDLLELKYQSLQQIAKREGIKANAKKDVIVDLLISKYPEGVPKNRAPALKRTRPLKKESEERSRPIKRQRTSLETNEAVQNWIQNISSAPPSPVHNNAHRASPTPDPGPPSPPHVYCFKGARRIRRGLAKLANGSATLHVEMKETEALLRHAEKINEKTAKELNKLTCNRRAMQVLTANIKRDSTILDGTYLMKSSQRDAWKTYAKEQDRLREEELELLDERLHQEQVERYEAAINSATEETEKIEDLPTGSTQQYEDDDELEYV